MIEETSNEKPKPLVSVIIPVYNVEDYLAGCISSVLAQSYANVEIVLVDDGSQDSSSSICDSYAELYSNIRVVHKENGGLSSARNTGMTLARGEYVMFVDSDDTIPEKAIEHLLEVAVCEHCDIVIPDRYHKVWTDGKKKLCFHFSEEMRDSNPRDFAVDVLIRHARAWRAHAFPLGIRPRISHLTLKYLERLKRLVFLARVR